MESPRQNLLFVCLLFLKISFVRCVHITKYCCGSFIRGVFSCVNNTTKSLFILHLMGTWAISSVRVWGMVLLWTFWCLSFGEHLYAFCWYIPRIKLLGHWVCLCSAFLNTAKQLPELVLWIDTSTAVGFLIVPHSCQLLVLSFSF